MPSREEGKLVLWPHYFDRNLTRKQGRRVKQEDAMERPKAGHIAQAARSVGLKAEILEDAKHPAFWHESTGCVIVEKAHEPKSAVLDQVARRL